MTQQAKAPQTERILDDFSQAVISGLSMDPKQIPCRFLYDARGSELFEDITRLEEYYPTRTEIGLLERYAPEIAELAGQGVALIEYGSGSSLKSRLLIDALQSPRAYVPIDISDAALSEAEQRLNGHYPRLAVLPVHADFNQPMELPDQIRGARRVGFFPGSTIGNHSRAEAIEFFARAAKLLGPDGALVIGVDLKKDPKILIPAYNDAKGVTAAFSLNLLERINRELSGTLDLAAFAHRPVYNELKGRIEIYLESLKDQEAQILDRTFSFAQGERVHVENSHKYTIEGFRELASESGWVMAQYWVDEQDYFSIHFLTRDN